VDDEHGLLLLADLSRGPPSGLFALYGFGQELLPLDGFRPQRISICFNLFLAGLRLGSPALFLAVAEDVRS